MPDCYLNFQLNVLLRPALFLNLSRKSSAVVTRDFFFSQVEDSMIQDGQADSRWFEKHSNRPETA